MGRAFLLLIRRCCMNQHQQYRKMHINNSPTCQFGLLLDIDGVILRGRNVLPGALESFRLLTDKQGKFRVPTVFVTNSGSTLRAVKARQLSEKLGVQVVPEQVILSHSPLRMFRQFHDRHVLVCGQGPLREIAKQLGFSRVTTVDHLRHAFPNLDCIDHRRRKYTPCAFEKYFPPIEAIILFGDPLRWETSLQLICDVLMTGGLPYDLPPNGNIPYPHIPLLACNMDLLWMAEARLPRFGHGAFMLCLETLFKKLTGRDLKYTALIGKPSELTYHHAEYCLKHHASMLSLTPPATIYAIGDNPESDVLGANLFEQFLSQRNLRKRPMPMGRKQVAQGSRALCYLDSRVVHDDETLADHGAEHCYSVLVETGVYSSASDLSHQLSATRHLGDLNSNSVLKTPAFVEKDIFAAVEMIFEREYFQ